MEFLNSSWLVFQLPKKSYQITVQMEYMSGQIFSIINPKYMDDIHEEAQKMFSSFELSILDFPVSDCSVIVTKLNEFERLSKQIYEYEYRTSMFEFHPKKRNFIFFIHV
jgi:hypothetical protein